MNRELKYLSLVFFVYYDKDSNKDFVLMSTIHDPLKLTKGMVNGYGGKCKDGESTGDCAVREVKEELGKEAEINADSLIQVGKILNNEKVVDVFIVKASEMFDATHMHTKDSEMINPTWYEFGEVDELQLLPRNLEVMQGVNKFIIDEREGREGEQFVVDKTNDVGTQMLHVGDEK